MTASLLDAARKLAPQIRASADEAEALRELPKGLFADLFDAGFVHMALPRSIGGAELDLPTYVQVIEEIGKADASTGWVVNQLAIFGTYASRMPIEMGRHIWIDTPRGCVANTPAATAKAVVVPGGYRVTGRQGFSTGSRNAAWVAAHAQVIDNGEVRRDEAGDPLALYLFVPVAEAELLDTWKVRGMRGTGTHHFAVNDVFVPAERTVLSTGAPLREKGPLYQVPRTLCFASGDAAVSLGMARVCLDTFMELAGSKTPRSVPTLLREVPMTQLHVGQAEAALRSGRAFLMEAVRDIWEAALASNVTLEERAKLRLATTHGIRLAAQVIDTVYNAAGATAAYEDHLLQRHFQDIHVITQHLQGRFAHYELAGRYWLGLPIDEARL
ncbi:MAG TPA: acyl-CoA dehydrogenase family protein [Terriglobales bacterium]|nr:acyl-CoA dehydrogenase family protein [Terriglobales bacterium]